MGKPRATRKDKWNPSNPVIVYRKYKDIIKAQLPDEYNLPEKVKMTFFLPFPKSYSQKKKQDIIDNQESLHKVKPDVDNILKGVLDTLFENDSHVADVHVIKKWCTPGNEGILIQENRDQDVIEQQKQMILDMQNTIENQAKIITNLQNQIK